MKVSIQLELTASEVPFVTELLSTLRLLTDHAKTAPPVVVNTKELLQDVLSRMTGDNAAEAEKELAALLQDSAYGEVDTVVQEVVDVCAATALDLEQAKAVGGTAKYLEFLPKLPEPHKSKVRDKLIQKVLGQLAAKRTVDAQREEFFAHAEAFAALVHLDFIAIDGGVQTIERLVSKPATRAAAFTMLGKTVELCAPQLQGAAPSHLAALRGAVTAVTEPQFKYDIEYICSSLGWPTPPPTPAPELSAAGSNTQIPTPTAAAPRPPSATAHGPPAHPPPTSAAPPAPAATPPAGHIYTQLLPVTNLPPLQAPVYALALDPATGELACGGPNHLTVYSAAGELISQPEVPYNTMVVSMDRHERHRLLATSNVPSATHLEGPPCIVLYDHTYQQRAICPKPRGTVLTCIRAFAADSDHLLAAESLDHPTAAGRKHELIAVYDVSRLASSPQLQPLLTFDHHQQMVTCLATSPAAPTAFVSGSADCTVRLWDTRAPGPVAHLVSEHGTAHTQMVTGVDMTEHCVVSGSSDGVVTLWDLRRAAQPGTADASAVLMAIKVDGHPIVRLEMRGAPAPTLMAVSTAASLNLVEFSSLAAPVRIGAHPFPDTLEGPTHDIRWGSPHGILYATGNNCRIDLYQAV